MMTRTWKCTKCGRKAKVSYEDILDIGTPICCDEDMELLPQHKPKAIPEPQVMIRFECGQEGRISKDFGPFPFVQATYEQIRVGPDGDAIACWNQNTGHWILTRNHTRWSDFVISPFVQ